MQITTEQVDTTLVVIPAGRLDSNNATSFEKTVTDYVRNGERRIVIDLSQIDYISSAGLRVVLMLVKQLKGSNGSLVLCGMKPSIKEVFDISGFSKILQIRGTRAEALAAG